MTWVDEMFGFGMARVSLLYWPVLIATNWLADLVCGTGPKISI